MKIFLMMMAFLGMASSAFARQDPMLTTATPCDAPVAATQDPAINYQEPPPAPGQVPVTTDNGFATGTPSVQFPIEAPLGDLQNVPNNFIDSRVPVGSVTVDQHGTALNILNLKPTPPAPASKSGCTHLNGK